MISGRTLLVLGRVSNLSTVWSNCLCAWIIAGGDSWGQFASALLGMSALYVGGMYLNDYCDLEFDRTHRPERPIPSGQVEGRTVLLLTLVFLGFGWGAVGWINFQAALWGMVLVGLIVTYNLFHKKTVWGVPLMAACRASIYLVVGVASGNKVSTDVVWAALVMFVYVAGVTGLARTESTRNDLPIWALGLLGMPLGFILVRAESWLEATLIGSFLLSVGWTIRSLRRARAGSKWIIGKSIGPLLAGICLLDLMILSSLSLFSPAIGVSFGACFVIALLAQRRIPAT